ncbi:MAG: hypothetical protein HOO96_18405 [Polyangiaceae bacterium]|jgi:hypothetical protein|nr:hypothetical protein [Polyangiaceae bacterium]
MSMLPTRLALAAAILSTLATGCLINVDDNPPPPTYTSSTPDPQPVKPTAPILARLDADKTMNAKGGDGVGVFVEYQSGGHWHVWWTCDTSLTGQACTFTHQITGGPFRNIKSEGAGRDANDSIATTSTVTSGVADMFFDTDAGATITIQSTVAGADNADGRYFFFVQEGKVNGGFAGRLSNPLQFQPTSP